MKTTKLRSRIKRPRVLIIEDEVTLAEVCRAVLCQAGAEVHVVFDGADAHTALHTFNPDLILSDVRMPETRGDELLVHLLGERPNTPFILMTGLQRHNISVPHDSPNLFSLLYKPLEFDQLIRTVQNAIDLMEAKQVNDLLLEQWHAQSASAESFTEWQKKALVTLTQEWNKRRAS